MIEPTNRTGRAAGVVYLLIGVTAPFSMLYVPSKLFVRGDAAATAKKILANETLFRAGMLMNLISMVAFIFLAMLLYRLLNRVNRMQAALMVILVVVSVPVALVNVVSQLGALTLLRGTNYLEVFSRAQLEAAALYLLGLRGAVYLVAQIFWGLWLFPFGLLVMRSGFIPRILGILLLVNGLAYPVISLTMLLAPEYTGLANRIAFPAELGELWVMLWLTIRGARVS